MDHTSKDVENLMVQNKTDSNIDLPTLLEVQIIQTIQPMTFSRVAIIRLLNSTYDKAVVWKSFDSRFSSALRTDKCLCIGRWTPKHQLRNNKIKDNRVSQFNSSPASIFVPNNWDTSRELIYYTFVRDGRMSNFLAHLPPDYKQRVRNRSLFRKNTASWLDFNDHIEDSRNDQCGDTNGSKKFPMDQALLNGNEDSIAATTSVQKSEKSSELSSSTSNLPEATIAKEEACLRQYSCEICSSERKAFEWLIALQGIAIPRHLADVSTLPFRPIEPTQAEYLQFQGLLMEHIDGLTLDKYLKTHQSNDVLPVLQDCIRLLHLFSYYGFHHGDLAPPNIIVVKNPPPDTFLVRVIDLGSHQLLERKDDMDPHLFFALHNQEQEFFDNLAWFLQPGQHSYISELETGRFVDWGSTYTNVMWECIMDIIWGDFDDPDPLLHISERISKSRFSYRLASSLTRLYCNFCWPAFTICKLADTWQWDLDSVLKTSQQKLALKGVLFAPICNCESPTYQSTTLSWNSPTGLNKGLALRSLISDTLTASNLCPYLAVSDSLDHQREVSSNSGTNTLDSEDQEKSLIPSSLES
ncbi:MAG: hypothetical protein Q9227_009572 [Pyrenula ochraceoflavens]